MADTNSLQTFEHSDKDADTFIQNIDSLNVDSSYYLAILAGENSSAKKGFLKKIKKKTGDQLLEVDLRDVVSSVEEESYYKIDEMVDSLGSHKYILFRNGDQLGGVYTGHSFSVRRYATPQERHLLKRIRNSEKVYLLDLEDEHTVNNTLRRHAQTLISFRYPTTFFGKLKQITLNGSSFASNRKALI